MIDRAGHFFFRHRNVLFPMVLGVLLIVFRPQRFGNLTGDMLLAIGLAFLVVGQGLRVVTIGLDYIKRGGKDGRIYANRLVTGGIYRHTRNPMYAGNILIVLGWLLVAGNLIAMAIGGAFFVTAYMLIMASEERYLRNEFGEAYAAYSARVPRWLPRWSGLITTIRSYRFDWPAVIVKEYGTIVSTLVIMIALLAWKAQETGVLSQSWPVYAGAGVLCAAMWGAARYLKKVTQLKPRGVTPVRGAIDDQRRRIDVIDAAILDLLNERAGHVSAIFEIKRAAHMPRFDSSRTQQIITRLQTINQGPLSDAQVEAIFGAMLHHFAFEHDRSKAAAEVDAVRSPHVDVAAVT